MDGYSLTEKMRKARRRFRFTATEQALFHELVAVCNDENWRDVFDCSNIELCFALNINERTLMKARESLINAGMIYYKSGKSKRSISSYSFIKPFKTGVVTTVNNTTVPPTNSTTNETTNTPTDKAAKEPDYNKQYKTKLNISPIIPNGDEVDDEFNFDSFWDLYDKKIGRKDKIQKKWDKLSVEDKQKAMNYIPKYKESQPNKQYRKNPETFLNNKSWNDELIFRIEKRELNGKSERNTDIQSGTEAQKDYSDRF